MQTPSSCPAASRSGSGCSSTWGSGQSAAEISYVFHAASISASVGSLLSTRLPWLRMPAKSSPGPAPPHGQALEPCGLTLRIPPWRSSRRTYRPRGLIRRHHGGRTSRQMALFRVHSRGPGPFRRRQFRIRRKPKRYCTRGPNSFVTGKLLSGLGDAPRDGGVGEL